MTADFSVLLDACVLANFGVCDLFLRLSTYLFACVFPVLEWIFASRRYNL